MKLHQLVGLRNELQQAVDLSAIVAGVEKNKSSLGSLLVQANDSYAQKISNLIEKHSKVIEIVNQDIAEVQNIIDSINRDITEATSKFFVDNYQTECLFTDPRDIRQVKIMVMPEGVEEILAGRVNLYSSWKYAALEIGCRDGEWTRRLIASDPLYITDMHEEFVNSTASKFNIEYQARLRKYLIKDFKIDNLPVHQFGFIFSYNFFNYLSLDSIKQLLIQANTWLKPGGVMLFTYNNTDLSASAGMSENYFMTYVPKSMLIPLVESLGFEVIAAPDYLPSTSWIEIRKPGILHTVKAHQALGEIKFK